MKKILLLLFILNLSFTGCKNDVSESSGSGYKTVLRDNVVVDQDFKPVSNVEGFEQFLSGKSFILKGLVIDGERVALGKCMLDDILFFGVDGNYNYQDEVICDGSSGLTSSGSWYVLEVDGKIILEKIDAIFGKEKFEIVGVSSNSFRAKNEQDGKAIITTFTKL